MISKHALTEVISFRIRIFEEKEEEKLRPSFRVNSVNFCLMSRRDVHCHFCPQHGVRPLLSALAYIKPMSICDISKGLKIRDNIYCNIRKSSQKKKIWPKDPTSYVHVER